MLSSLNRKTAQKKTPLFVLFSEFFKAKQSKAKQSSRRKQQNSRTAPLLFSSLLFSSLLFCSLLFSKFFNRTAPVLFCSLLFCSLLFSKFFNRTAEQHLFCSVLLSYLLFCYLLPVFNNSCSLVFFLFVSKKGLKTTLMPRTLKKAIQNNL